MPPDNFVPPAPLETPLADAPMREVFGPLLHLVRWRHDRLDDVLATGN